MPTPEEILAANPYMADLIQPPAKPHWMSTLGDVFANVGGGLAQGSMMGMPWYAGLGAGAGMATAGLNRGEEQRRQQALAYMQHVQNEVFRQAQIENLRSQVEERTARTKGAEGFKITDVEPDQTPPQGSYDPNDTTPGGMERYRRAVSSGESGSPGGNYNAIGPVANAKGQRAHGRYQVMDFNVGPWTQEVLGKAMTPEEFRANPRAQDAVFDAKFEQSLKKYGNPQDAFSVWFSGQPLVGNKAGPDVLGTTVGGYVNKANRALYGSDAAPQVPMRPSGVVIPQGGEVTGDDAMVAPGMPVRGDVVQGDQPPPVAADGTPSWFTPGLPPGMDRPVPVLGPSQTPDFGTEVAQGGDQPKPADVPPIPVMEKVPKPLLSRADAARIEADVKARRLTPEQGLAKVDQIRNQNWTVKQREAEQTWREQTKAREDLINQQHFDRQQAAALEAEKRRVEAEEDRYRRTQADQAAERTRVEAAQAAERARVEAKKGIWWRNPATGQQEWVLDQDIKPGMVQADKSAEQKYTESQAKNHVYAAQFNDIMPDVEKWVTDDKGNYTTAKLPGNVPRSIAGSHYVPEFLVPADAKRWRQLETTILTAILRPASGATIKPDEYPEERVKFIPQPADPPDLVERKLQLLKVTARSIAEGTGRDTSTYPNLFAPEKKRGDTKEPVVIDLVPGTSGRRR